MRAGLHGKSGAPVLLCDENQPAESRLCPSALLDCPPRSPQVRHDKKKAASGDKKGAEGSLAKKGKDDERNSPSRPFVGRWVGHTYEMAYVAEEAGAMDLHVWVSHGQDARTTVAQMTGPQGRTKGQSLSEAEAVALAQAANNLRDALPVRATLHPPLGVLTPILVHPICGHPLSGPPPLVAPLSPLRSPAVPTTSLNPRSSSAPHGTCMDRKLRACCS